MAFIIFIGTALVLGIISRVTVLHGKRIIEFVKNVWVVETRETNEAYLEQQKNLPYVQQAKHHFRY